MISVESIISENFPSIAGKKSKTYHSLVRFLRYLFHENEFKKFGQNYPYLHGIDFIDQVLEYFDFSYTLSNREKERIPTTGRVVIVANHPIGSLDGLALLKLVSEVRSDVKAVANDMLLAIKPLQKLLLPVDNMGGKTVRENIKAIDAHLKSEGALIIFPAGAVSRMSPKGIRDGAWNSGFIRFAKKAKSPILPVYIDARNSMLFYSLSALVKPISTLWLVREMFKQARKDIRFRIGTVINYEIYNQLPFDLKSKAKIFKKHIYKIAKKKDGVYFKDDLKAIAHPEQRQELRNEIRECKLLGATADNKQIYLYNYQSDSVIMREIGRLREVSFRAVGEGTGKRRDVDQYDSYYDHIILWDDNNIELVGAYRLVRTNRFVEQENIADLYTATLFEYQYHAEAYLGQAIELGRSFVQPRYWGKRSLDYLWYGIGAYLKCYPEIRYLLGPVSISNSYPYEAKRKLVDFYQEYFPAETKWAIARSPFTTEGIISKNNQNINVEYKQGFSQLKNELADINLSIPVLYKQYSELCEQGGVQFVDFNVDKDFADCVDGLVVVDLKYLKEAKRQRYLG